MTTRVLSRPTGAPSAPAPTIKVASREEALRRAEEDFTMMVDTVFTAAVVYATKGAKGRCRARYCSPKATLRLTGPGDKAKLKEDLSHWADTTILAPYWDVTLAAPHPALDGFHGLWVFGPVYEVMPS